MLLGIGGSLWWWSRLARRDERMLYLWLAALLSAFVGGKFGYIAAQGWLDLNLPDPWTRLLTGKTVLGALLGGYGGVELAKRLLGYPQVTGDWFAVVVPAGITLGRFGCLLGGCCLGQVCEHDHWWTLADTEGHPRWPAVPVEIAFNLAAIAAFAVLRRTGRLPGQHFHLYLIAYGLFRFGHELWRDTPRIVGPFSGYAFLALALAALGAIRFYQRSLTTAVNS
jgi:phosphatidylglycerol:prolipoprotein diacylglycerol transferase